MQNRTSQLDLQQTLLAEKLSGLEGHIWLEATRLVLQLRLGEVEACELNTVEILRLIF